MKRALAVIAVALMCCGCATSGSMRVGEFDLDLRSEERVAVEAAAKANPTELLSVPAPGFWAKLIDILPLKIGRGYVCLFSVEWGEDE